MPAATAAVVVPWGGDRIDLLLAQLSRLTEQELTDPLEIRVAANRPISTEQRTQIMALGADGRPVLVVDASARRGPSAARNIGAHPVPRFILFCDADDEADPGWAAAMLDELRGGADVVGGALDYEPLNAVPFALSRANDLPVAFGHLRFSPSASLGITGSLFKRLGGFDESLLSGEDIDLCWRAQYAGAKIAFASRARMSYRLRQAWHPLFNQGRRYGWSDVQLYRRHRARGMRRTLVDGAGEVARVLVLTGLALRGRTHRLKLAAKLGTVVGHLEGSARSWTLFL